jgi:hypothetical protein
MKVQYKRHHQRVHLTATIFKLTKKYFWGGREGGWGNIFIYINILEEEKLQD